MSQDQIVMLEANVFKPTKSTEPASALLTGIKTLLCTPAAKRALAVIENKGEVTDEYLVENAMNIMKNLKFTEVLK